MKKLIVVIGFLAIELTGYGQIWLTDALDSTRVRYATFEASSTSGMSADMFFKNYLDLEKPNRLVPSDTLYSPDSAYCHIKYRQYFGKYYVENSRLTLTFHHNNIIRFKGYYLHITTIEEEKYRVEDAIDLYKHYYNISADSCVCRVELLITEDTSPNPKAVLCFKIQSDNPSLMNQLLYVSVSDLSIIKEESIPISGFNATLPTRYNGVRYGQQSGVYPLYELHDNRAAVRIMKIDSGVTNLGTGIPNTFYNKTDIWDNYSDSTYPQHILDAYWAACQYSYYMQDTFHCPKDYFQRTWVPEPEHFEVMDTTTWVYVALNTFIDNTKWMRILYYHQNKEQGIDIMRNIIVIGAPGLNHYPKASIDETVHEYAHIFSHQSWEPKYLVSNRIDNEICEACADIWAAIITNSIYHDETKTWKIGEDVVLPTSGHTCIRNLANPSDSNAEIQMNDNRCQEPGISAYERSGIFSHWFYLLTHGYSGEGCTGICYTFEGIPIDSAAKLMYYLEKKEIVHYIDSYEQLAQYTLDATENFSDPGIIKSSVLGAWNVLGVKPLSSGIEQFGLSYSSLNDETYMVDENLVVDSSRTLTIEGNVYLCDTCSIIIQPGCKLIVDGGTLTSACPNEMWQGIEVLGDRTKRQLPQYQGTVELRNGATIENAHCGIHTGYHDSGTYATTGGIILADSANFVNNRRSVAFLSYENTHPNGSVANNLSSFRRCVFSVNDNNHFMQDSCPFIDHVTMWEVRGVKFKGCRFENTSTMPGDRRHAIYTENAGFEVDSHCDVQYYNGCECPEPYTVCCEFSGFTTAVEANTDGDPRAVVVNGARFFNNVTGVKINGTNFATVTRNDFNLQSRPSSPSNTGLYLNACGGYQVEGNRFHRAGLPVTSTSTGIRVENNGNTDNSIYRNVFDTLSYGIDVYGTNGDANGGLQMLCGDFNGNVTDIRLATIKTTVSQQQGSLQVSAGNTFDGTSGYNIQSLANQNIVYFHTGKAVPGNPHYPGLRTTNVFPYLILSANSCASTFCSGGTPKSLAGFQSDMNAYSTAMAAIADTDGRDIAGGTGVETQNFASLQQGGTENLLETAQSLSDSYYTAVRTLMSDSLLDLGTLEQWHTAAQPIADPYSLTETRFCEGYAELFAADVDDAEMANYAEFHAMKLALRVQNDNLDNQDNSGTPFVNWYALTPAQIAQLQTIAERNTGRASVMAKGALCFFHGICYEDDLLVDDNGDNNAGTRAKRVTTDIADDAALTVYPNPTDDLLFVELRGVEIARVALYDLQGRMVTGTGAHAGAPQQGTTATMNMRNVPAGVYLLCVTAADGKEYHRKIVKR